MSLAAWQSALVELVGRGADGSAPTTGGGDAVERSWLAMAAEHPGTAITRDVVRSWRWRRVVVSAPLTLLMLRRLGLLEEVRAAYLDDTFAPSSYTLAEGRQFLTVVEQRWGTQADADVPAGLRHLLTIAALERAILVARASTWTTNIRTSRADDEVAPGVGGLIHARCDASELLRCLLADQPLPAPDSGHGAFLAAPGIEGGFREATPGEIRALTMVGAGCPVTEVAGLWPNDLIDPFTLTRLESIGALVRQPPPAASRISRALMVGSPA